MHGCLLIVHRNLSSAAGKPGTRRTCEPLDGRTEETSCRRVCNRFGWISRSSGRVHSTPTRLRVGQLQSSTRRDRSAHVRSSSFLRKAHVFYPEVGAVGPCELADVEAG